MRSTIALTGALLAMVAGAPAAVAADPGGATHAVSREGFIIGFSLGAGDLGPDPCDDCGLGVGGDFHIGAMASRKVAVMLEGNFVTRDNLTHGLFGVAAQLWPDPAGRFWLKGGIGVGSLNHDDSFSGDRSTTTATTTSIPPCSGARASRSCAPDASRSTSSCAARPPSKAGTPPTASRSTSGRTGTEPEALIVELSSLPIREGPARASPPAG